MLLPFWPKEDFLKTDGFATYSGSREMLFGEHESITYENGFKTTTPKLALSCRPKSKYMKVVIFATSEKWKYVSWLAPGANKHARQQKHILADTSFAETK